MQTDQVPKGLTLLKGLSVFNPSEAFIDEFKHTWGLKLSFLDGDEDTLWIGSPDFRYSLVSFGSILFHIVVLKIFLLTIYINIINNRAKYAMDFILLLFLMLFIITIFRIASARFGIVYVLTNKRIAFLYAFNTPKILSFFSKKYLTRLNDGFFTIKNIENGEIYYDLGYIYKFDAMVLINGSIGTLIFEDSIDGNLQFTMSYRSGIKDVNIKNRIILQNIGYGLSPFNRFVAIRNAKEVAYLIDKGRRERLNLKKKIGVNI